MSLFRVKYLSFFFIIVTIFSFFNIIYSYYFNLYLNLNTYYVSLTISVIIGIFISVETDVPSGPSIVVVSAVLFFISHFFGKFLKKE